MQQRVVQNKEVQRADSPSKSQQLIDQFEVLLKTEMKKLATRLEDGSIDNHIKSAHIFNMRFKVFGQCFQQMNNEMATMLPNSANIYGSIYKNMHSIHHEQNQLLQLLPSNQVLISHRDSVSQL